jgi:hypothetical protein
MQHHQATTQIQTPQPPPRKNRNSSSHLGTHAVTLLEPDLVAPEEEDDDAQFVVVTFYKFVALEDPRAEVASHLHFLQVLLPSRFASVSYYCVSVYLFPPNLP